MSGIPTKRVDSKDDLHIYGRLDEYWKSRGFRLFGKDLRSGGQPLPTSVLNREKLFDQYALRNMFHLKGFEYGNWLNQEDRVSYLHAMAYALFDLNRILGFKNNIGLDQTIGIAFGARGRGSALAHFEPGTMMINLTRYHKTAAVNKSVMFQRTGGVGSFAHEYGHALDYFFGMYIEHAPGTHSLSDGRSLAIHFTPDMYPKDNYPLHHQMAVILHRMIWVKYDPATRKGKLTKFFEGLLPIVAKGGTYWIRHTELFARAFELWVHHKAKGMGLKNEFLTHTKYDHQVYMDPATAKRVIPAINALVKLMAEKARKVDHPEIPFKR